MIENRIYFKRISKKLISPVRVPAIYANKYVSCKKYHGGVIFNNCMYYLITYKVKYINGSGGFKAKGQGRQSLNNNK